MIATRSTRLALLALGGAAVALLASLGGSASAGPTPLCPEKTLCVFEHNEAGGQVVKLTKKGVSNKLAKKMNNEASSVLNETNKRIFLHDKRNGKGDRVCISPFGGTASLADFGDFNDRASSSKITKNKEDCPKKPV
jgi:hypothetical protein